jgi:hypothetical protein
MDEVAPDKAGLRSEGVAPNIAGRTVVGIFDRVEDAEAAAQALLAAGYSQADLSVLMQRPDQGPPVVADKTKANESAVAGASVGAILGGALGLAALAIPGIGPLLAAGPLAVALGGALTGGAVGTLAASMLGLSMPTEKQQSYEAAVRAGGILLSIKVPNQEAAEPAKQLLSDRGSREVASFEQAL